MRRCLIGSLAVLGLFWLASPAQPASHNPLDLSLASEPLAFTKNMGQWPDSILFRASTGGTTMWFTQDGIYYQFIKSIPRPHSGEEALAAGLGPRAIDPAGRWQAPDSIETALVKASFVGANPKAEAVGLEELAYKCNYFLGNDPTKWHTDVPNYAALTMHGIYPGVDATFRGKNGKLDYVLSGPAEAIEKVHTAFGGALATGQPDGSIILSTRLGEKHFHGIVPASSEPEPVALSAATSPGIVTLVYSTYLGGTDQDFGEAIALDDAGSAYVTGYTSSTDFPIQNPYQADSGDGTDNVFITKLSPDGSSLVYSTYLGGSSGEYGKGITIDTAGCAYVTGFTFSDNFPIQNSYQTDQDSTDLFVAKLSPAGNSLIYSTYLGGNIEDRASDIAIDGSGSAYVTGWTNSTNFPTQSPYQTDQPNFDAFVAKLSPDGSSLVYSTYLGGNNLDYGWGIAVDDSDCAYVTGETWSSTDFPIQSPYQSSFGGAGYDAFVTKLSPSGNSLVYSTYLGGSDGDCAIAIAVDSAGSAYVTGSTVSTDFPTQTPYQTYRDSSDVFVSKLSPDGSSLVYSTYLGGNDDDGGSDITVDGSGCAYVTGFTASTNFPTQSYYQTFQDLADVFVTKLSATGHSLVYSTYLGGANSDYGRGIAVDEQGNTYVAGDTWSTDFPTESPYQTHPGNIYRFNAFVTKLPPIAVCCVGTTGNVDETGIVDLADLSLLITYLTITPKLTLSCPPAANVNATGIIDLTDLSVLIAFLTLSPPPALPNCP